MRTLRIFSTLSAAFLIMTVVNAQVKPPVPVRTPAVLNTKTIDRAILESVSDIDGNVYKTVTIGAQTWMAENLRTTKLNDGTPIALATGPAYWSQDKAWYTWYFFDDEASHPKYGALYNWKVIETNKLCPAGWHVPSNDEWNTLENYLITNGYNFDGSTVGRYFGKAMAVLTDWKPISVPGRIGNTDYPEFRNKSGFSALPAGIRSENGSFYGLTLYGSWWTTTQVTSGTATVVKLKYDDFSPTRDTRSKKEGDSVRCVKD